MILRKKQKQVEWMTFPQVKDEKKNEQMSHLQRKNEALEEKEQEDLTQELRTKLLSFSQYIRLDKSMGLSILDERVERSSNELLEKGKKDS